MNLETTNFPIWVFQTIDSPFVWGPNNICINNNLNKDIMATLGFVPCRLGSNYAEVSFNRDGTVFVFGTDSRGNGNGKDVFLLCEE